jgi:antitoxin VapB
MVESLVELRMSLNIKSAEAHRLALELSRETGESLTQAVTQAVRERLERVRGERRGRLADRLLEIGRACAPRLKPPLQGIDHGEFLYDEKGLPG